MPIQTKRSFYVVAAILLLFAKASVTAQDFQLSDQGADDSVAGVAPDSSNIPARKIPRRPPVGWNAEWIMDSDSGLAASEAHATIPLLKFFGSPPPLVKTSFGYTRLFSDEFELPANLFEYSIGLTWIRPMNDRWTVLSMLGVSMATDNENRSSDAWQFRGGVFGIYKRSESWQWTFGVLATGRGDLPIIPAIGAVWQPKPGFRADLTFPRPRLNWLVSERESRQQWVYLGAGLKGTTWAWQAPGDVDDQLTYRDWRLVAGWESRPVAEGGMPFALGRTLAAEVGFAFARQFEFEQETRTESLDDAAFMAITTRF